MKKALADAENLLIFKMDYNNFYLNYSNSISNLLKEVNIDLIEKTVDLILKTNSSNNSTYIVGNGGSASIASHVSVDLAKVSNIKSATFNNANLITCFANDYGYEHWVKEAIKAYCANNDLVILISSSGKSNNIINAAKYCTETSMNLITFSGFDNNNELNQLGKINFHVNSKDYNHIEMVHNIILLSIVDILKQKKL